MSELFIKNNPQPIFVYEKDSLRFLDANDAALRLYGYSLDELLQMDVTDLYTSEDIQTILESSDEIFRSGEFSKPFKHRRKDGNYIFVRISRIEYNHEGSASYLNILDNVSDPFNPDIRREIFKAAFDNTTDMIFITDSEGVINYVNEAAYRNLGMTSSELVSTQITSLCGEEDQLLITNSVFQSHLKETVTFTIGLKTSAGSILDADITSTPIFDSDNKVDLFVLVAKAASPSPTELSQESSTKVVKEDLMENSAVTIARPDGNELSGAYITTLFHELLTPLNVILGFSKELTESIEAPSAEQKEAADIMNQNHTLLLNLMNTIIEYSEIQFNKAELELSEINITEVIENFDKSIKEITGIRDVEFAYGKISSSLKFETDKKRFYGLLNNLFRLISVISPQKKLYFSAYPVDNACFNISISDSFGKSSAPFIETLKILFLEKKEPKLLGISNLTIKIINSVLESLKGKFIVINEFTEKHDIAFQFPINLSEKPEKSFIEEMEEPMYQTEGLTQEAEEMQFLDESEEIIIEEELDEISSLSEDTKESNVLELDESEDDVEPPVVAEEIKTETKPEIQKSKNGFSHLRCLYIEDQVDSQILFKVQMKDLQNIQFATSFEEALPLLESNDFDFIIMDINLQGEYNGVDALKVIHQIPKLQNIPVIAVTAYVLPGDKEKFIATGFTDFISKPIFRDKLVESLNKIFVN